MTTEREIEALERELMVALSDLDFDWLARHWAPDGVYIHASGKLQDTREFLDYLRARPSAHLDRQTRDVKIRTYGDTAIVTGTGTMRILVAGAERQWTNRFTRVYVKSDGRWLLASHHSGADMTEATTSGTARTP